MHGLRGVLLTLDKEEKLLGVGVVVSGKVDRQSNRRSLLLLREVRVLEIGNGKNECSGSHGPKDRVVGCFSYLFTADAGEG